MGKQVRYFFYAFLGFISFSFADVWNGADYAKNSSVQLSHGERLLSHLALNGDERILDVGCGDGKITALLAQKAFNGVVIGIDPSFSMLAKARDFYCQNDFPNLSFYEGSAETFKGEEPFDHIVAIHVMHWIKDQEKALKNIYALLKSGGKAHLILAPTKEGLPFDLALKRTLKTWESDFVDFENPQQVFDMETYRKMLIQAGFHVRSIHYIYHETVHENKEKLRDWIKQWLPYGKYLSFSKQTLFLNELMHHYLLEIQAPVDTKESVPWGEYVLIIEAEKVS